MRVVATFGGGVNSTAMLILAPRVDLVLFADTGGERAETYEHVARFSSWLVAHGKPPVTTVRAAVTLEADCLRRRALPSVAYGFKTCSQRWKLRPQEKFLNAWRRDGEVIQKLVGYDAGEPHRAKKYDDAKTVVRYPLIEAGLFREDCEETCARNGFRDVPKSSCFFCPNMRKEEVRRLPDDLKARAIALESNADLSKAAQLRGLGRFWNWRDFLAGDSQQSVFDYEREMPCGCVD